MLKYIFIIVSGLIIMGCAQNHVWTKPGITQDQFRKDLYECERDIMGFPYPPNYPSSVYTSNPDANLIAASKDLENAGLQLAHNARRQEMFIRCMESKGYILKNKN
jgi:hypothetical protein